MPLPMNPFNTENSTLKTAFDPAAADYDRDFTITPIGRYLRAQTHTRLDLHFQPGQHVLELGCGTGEDALYLAGRGLHVTATDASEAMRSAAGAKLAGHPLATVAALNLAALPPAGFSGPYDGVFANFGPLNCLADWQPLATWLAGRVRPGGVVALGVMGPLCPWEIGWHGLHGDFRTALRRFRQDTAFQLAGGQPITVRYPSPRRLLRDFAPHFRRVCLRGLGVFLPPSDVYGALERRPRLLRTLTWLEGRFARRLGWFADHYWIEFQRASR